MISAKQVQPINIILSFVFLSTPMPKKHTLPKTSTQHIVRGTLPSLSEVKHLCPFAPFRPCFGNTLACLASFFTCPGFGIKFVSWAVLEHCGHGTRQFLGGAGRGCFLVEIAVRGDDPQSRSAGREALSRETDRGLRHEYLLSVSPLGFNPC